jgi:hypothetical protein
VTGPGETDEGSQRKEMGETGLLVEGARDRRCCASAHKNDLFGAIAV